VPIVVITRYYSYGARVKVKVQIIERFATHPETYPNFYFAFVTRSISTSHLGCFPLWFSISLYDFQSRYILQSAKPPVQYVELIDPGIPRHSGVSFHDRTTQLRDDDFTMAEESTQPQRGLHRGRGGRRGRYRRGHRQGPRRQESDGEASQPSPAPPTRPAPPAQPAQSGSVIIPSPAIAVPGSGDVVREAGNQLGRGRGGRGRRGDSRRGTGQRSIVVSHRGGRRPPPISGQRGNNTPGLELRAAASEFVPGQPIQSSRSVV
jgi:hypothetical protein